MSALVDAFRRPELWPLLLGAAIPLALHLLDRRRAPRVEWPALRFLRIDDPIRLRWIRLREALLILLRTLAILAFALALMGPESREEVLVASRPELRRGLVLVVDTSASTARRHRDGSGSTLDHIRETAQRLLGALVPGDAAIVVDSAGSSADPVDPFDIDAAREAVRGLTPRGVFDLRRGLDAGIAAAVTLPTATRDVVVLSDFQATSVGDLRLERWSFLAEAVRSATPSPRLVWIDCGDTSTTNHFVASLDRADLMAGTDEPVEIVAEVHVDPSDAGEVTARWSIDDEPREAELLGGASGASRQTLRLAASFERPGLHRVRLELTADSRADGLDDDALELEVEVRDRLPVLVLDTRGATGEDAAGRFVELALWPRAPGGTTPRVVFRPQRLDRLPAGGLPPDAVIVVADVPLPDPAEAMALREHVARGAGLVLFSGSSVDADGWNEAFGSEAADLLPAPLLGASRDPTRPGALDPEHSALAAFVENDASLLDPVHVRGRARVGGKVGDTRILARFADGSPWILARALGAGRVVLVTTGASTVDSELPRTPLWLPLVHRLCRWVAAGSAQRAAAARIPAVESRLARPDAEPLAALETALGVRRAQDGVERLLHERRTTVTREAWPWALAVALAALLAELLLLRRFGHGARPRAVS